MVKKKVLKVLIGEGYDKDTKKNFPVYASYWAQEDGSYTRTEKIFVQEVEIPDKQKSSAGKIDA